MLRQWLWIMVCYTEPVVVNHGGLCRASGCKSWCVLLSYCLWVMVSYAEPKVNYGVYCRASNYAEAVVANHVVLCWNSGCQSLCYPEQVVVNRDVSHGVLFWASGCEWWCAMLSPVVVNCDVLYWAKWLWITTCYAEPSGWESWCVMPNQWLWSMVCCAEPVVVNHGLLCWASGCESWCGMLSAGNSLRPWTEAHRGH